MLLMVGLELSSRSVHGQVSPEFMRVRPCTYLGPNFKTRIGGVKAFVGEAEEFRGKGMGHRGTGGSGAGGIRWLGGVAADAGFRRAFLRVASRSHRAEMLGRK